jgi:hypothetical protein
MRLKNYVVRLHFRMSVRNKKRFVPGSFQRGIDFNDELEEHLENMNRYQLTLAKRQAQLFETETQLLGAEDEDEEIEERIDDLNDEIDRITTHLKRLKHDEDVLRKLRVSNRPNVEQFELRLQQMNDNFYDEYSRAVQMQRESMFDLFFEDKALDHPSTLVIPRLVGRKPLLLKVGEPGHVTCVIIHFDEPICEIWDTAQVNGNVKRWFRSVLPEAYVVVCIDAQLQIGWCETGMKRNIYIVKTKTKKPYINIYCQTWPFFFAYMRCVKGYTAGNIIRFLSCLTDEQKIVLIDEFNNNLANDGKDVQYIREINDKKSFMSYVRTCKPLGDLNRYVTFADANDTFEELSDEEQSFYNEIKSQLPRALAR